MTDAEIKERLLKLEKAVETLSDVLKLLRAAMQVGNERLAAFAARVEVLEAEMNQIIETDLITAKAAEELTEIVRGGVEDV